MTRQGRRGVRSWKPRNRYKGAIARLRSDWGGRCQCEGCEFHGRTVGQCERVRRLEFAHVAPTPIVATYKGHARRGRGRAERYHDIKKHPECYRLMCDGCHLELDSVNGAQLPAARAFGPAVDYPEPDEQTEVA